MSTPPVTTSPLSQRERRTFKPGDALTERYQVRRALGRSPLGERFVCFDRHRARPVLMQRLDPDLVLAKRLYKRFVRCVEVLQTGTSDFFIEVYDLIDEPGLVAMVTSLIDGPTLADYIEHYGPLPEDLAASLFRDIADALLSLHENNHHAHGALAPHNIWLEQRGEQLIPHVQGLEQSVMLGSVPNLARLLQPYRPPEITPKDAPTTLGDIYGLGMTLFESLTGRRPEGDEVTRLREFAPDISGDLEELITQSIAEDPSIRFQSMVAIRNILDSISLEHQVEAKASAERPEAGDVIAGQYEVIKMLGEGGMARVYLAKDQMLGTTVAIKLLNATCLAEREVVERFLDEASIQAQLVHPEPHPNVVAVLRVLRNEPIGFVMEFVPGTTLDEYIGDPDLNIAHWIDMFAQICAGLEHAHKHRIIHRDLKPSNILVGIDEKGERTAKLMDFGISKQLDQPKTRTNLVLGTLGYLSPELFGSAKDASAQSDLYAIGCCMFEVFTGQVPFPVDGGLRQLAFRVYSEAPPRPSDLGVEMPVALEALIMKCLAKAPGERPPSSMWLHDRLLSILEERDDPLLQETVKVLGLKPQRSGIFGGGGSSTLRKYVSQEQLDSIRSTGRHSRSSFIDTNPGLESLIDLPEHAQPASRRGLWVALLVLLLVSAGIIIWVVMQPDSEGDASSKKPRPEVVKAEGGGGAGIVLSADDLFAQVQAAKEAGNKDEMRALIAQLQAQAEEMDVEKLKALAELSEEVGDLDGASEVLATAVKRGGDGSLLAAKVELDIKREDIDAALEDRDALCEDPANADICAKVDERMRTAADSLVESGQLANAERLFDGSQGDASSDERTRFLSKLGEAAEDASDLDRAANAYEEASKENSESFLYHWKQVEIANKRKRYSQALSLLNKARPLAETPEEKEQVDEMAYGLHMQLAQEGVNTGNDSMAVKHLTAALGLAPGKAERDSIKRRLFDTHIAAADEARARNDPSASLEALKRAQPYTPDRKSERDVADRIKRLERMLKRKKRGEQNVMDTPLPPDQIQLWIESSPDRARVFHEGRALGRTPLIVRLPKTQGPVPLKMKLLGYFEESVEIDGHLGGQYDVKLRYRPREIK